MGSAVGDRGLRIGDRGLRIGQAGGWVTATMTGAALAAIVAILGVKQPEFYRGLLGVVCLALLVLIAARDVTTLRAPNRLVYPGVGIAILGALTLGWGAAGEALLGGLVAFGALLAAAVASRGRLGHGDVKVGGLCGLVVGLHGVAPMLVVAFGSGAVVAAVVLALRLRQRTDVAPFTPFLVAGTLFSLGSYPLYLWS